MRRRKLLTEDACRCIAGHLAMVLQDQIIGSTKGKKALTDEEYEMFEEAFFEDLNLNIGVDS